MDLSCGFGRFHTIITEAQRNKELNRRGAEKTQGQQRMQMQKNLYVLSA